MESISTKDRDILRGLAARQRDYAHDAKNEAILKKWYALEYPKLLTASITPFTQ